VLGRYSPPNAYSSCILVAKSATSPSKSFKEGVIEALLLE